jgi:hypothetical protein
VVGVLGDSATHSAGVVGEDAAETATADGCRVRSYFRAVEVEGVVGMLTENAGLHANASAIFFHAAGAPVAANVYEDAIGDGLSGKAGAAGPKDERDRMIMAEAKEVADFFGVGGLDDGARNEAIKACVGCESNSVDFPDQNAGPVDAVFQQGENFVRREGRRFKGHGLRYFYFHCC